MCRYAAGDETVFQPLFALLAPRIRAFFYRSFSDGQRADDLMVKTFRALRVSRATFRPELSLKPWLFGIAAGVRRDELRGQYALPSTAGEAELAQAEARKEAAGVAPITEGLAVVHHGQDCGVEAARDAIARLPESQRVVMHLQVQEGLTLEEIAGVLVIDQRTVRDRARTAYERLRCELRRYLSPSEVA
jgi:RNA polymerase sigma-70 factor (ECF subfamily)